MFVQEECVQRQCLCGEGRTKWVRPALCLGTYVNPRGVGVSDERGTTHRVGEAGSVRPDHDIRVGCFL